MTATWRTPIASCNLCGASWAMPKDEPHDCAVKPLLAALEAIVLHADMPAGESWEASYADVTSMARDALAVGKPQ